MTLDIAAIKARADKATAGPWELSPHSIGKAGWISGEHGSYTDIVITAGTDRALTNADFIAHARTDIPALIAALEASEAARVKAEQERDALKEALKMPDADRRQWLLSELVSAKGYFNRVDLCEAFGISIPQASTDIRRFLTAFPGLVEYDKTAKRYARRALEAKP